ncbi:MAG: hypothetical protein Edafosvirus6_57, partial [Edafosvirus sp.]
MNQNHPHATQIKPEEDYTLKRKLDAEQLEKEKDAKRIKYDQYKKDFLKKNAYLRCDECDSTIYNDEQNIVLFRNESLNSKKSDIIYCKKCA